MRTVREKSREPAVQTEARRKRVPLGVPRLKLAVPSRSGFKRRWINDEAGRVQNALDASYRFVEDPTLIVGEDSGNQDTGSKVSRIVGRKRNGQPLRAFLMEIEEELYEEDQAAKQEPLDEMDRQIKKGQLISEGAESRYVPDRGIRINRSDADDE